MSDWIASLEPAAADVVATWRGIDEEQPLSLRRAIRRRAGPGTTDALVGQLDALSVALIKIIATLPDEAFGLPGGEADWTVAEAIGHDAAARSGLVHAAALAAADRWPVDAPTIVPGIPGSAGLGRADLVRKVEQSQRIVARSARQLTGHETDTCPLLHPLVGRLRCGEWLLFAGIHDLMHLEQLHAIAAGLDAAAPGSRSA